MAVVGLGYWGPQLVRNLHFSEGCSQLVACDVNPDKVKAVLRQYPAAQGATDLREVLDDPEIQAVVVATPVSTHFDLAMQCLDHGRSVLVEKPLATSVREARTLMSKARESGLLAMAAHTFLYSPAVRLVKSLIDDGVIGDPLYVQSSRVNLGIHQSDVSVVWDLAPHDISILNYWLDEYPSAVSAMGRSSHEIGPADVAFIDLRYPRGCIANLHLSWLAPTKLRRTTLVGSQRMVIYEDTNSEEPVKIFDKGVELPDPQDFGQFKASYRLGDVTSPRVEVWEPLRVEIDDFLTRVASGETPDEREEAAVATIAATEAAQTSLERDGSLIDL